MIALVLPLFLAVAPPEVTVLVSGDVTLGYHYEEYVDEQVKKGKPRDAMVALTRAQILLASGNDQFRWPHALLQEHLLGRLQPCRASSNDDQIKCFHKL